MGKNYVSRETIPDIAIEEEADLVEVARLVEDKTSQYSALSCLPDAANMPYN